MKVYFVHNNFSYAVLPQPDHHDDDDCVKINSAVLILSFFHRCRCRHRRHNPKKKEGE